MARLRATAQGEDTKEAARLGHASIFATATTERRKTAATIHMLHDGSFVFTVARTRDGQPRETFSMTFGPESGPLDPMLHAAAGDKSLPTRLDQ